VSVTFGPEPDPAEHTALDYHIVCVLDPRRDQRTFGTYLEAVTGLDDHDRHCGDLLCWPDTRYVVARTAADVLPWLNLSNLNAALLRALGVLPELGAAAVLDTAPRDRDTVTELPGVAELGAAGYDDLAGECDADDLLGRIELALALSPADVGVPWHATTAAGSWIDCGRPPGYLQQRLHELRAITVHARHLQRRVSWN